MYTYNDTTTCTYGVIVQLFILSVILFYNLVCYIHMSTNICLKIVANVLPVT